MPPFTADQFVKVAAATAAMFTASVALIAAIFQWLRERGDRRRQERQFILERRAWAEKLNNEIEMELIKLRLKTYPSLLSSLMVLSKHKHDLLPSDFRALGDALQKALYEEAALCMREQPHQTTAHHPRHG